MFTQLQKMFMVVTDKLRCHHNVAHNSQGRGYHYVQQHIKKFYS